MILFDFEILRDCFFLYFFLSVFILSSVLLGDEYTYFSMLLQNVILFHLNQVNFSVHSIVSIPYKRFEFLLWLFVHADQEGITAEQTATKTTLNFRTIWWQLWLHDLLRFQLFLPAYSFILSSFFFFFFLSSIMLIIWKSMTNTFFNIDAINLEKLENISFR